MHSQTHKNYSNQRRRWSATAGRVSNTHLSVGFDSRPRCAPGGAPDPTPPMRWPGSLWRCRASAVAAAVSSSSLTCPSRPQTSGTKHWMPPQAWRSAWTRPLWICTPWVLPTQIPHLCTFLKRHLLDVVTTWPTSAGQPGWYLLEKLTLPQHKRPESPAPLEGQAPPPDIRASGWAPPWLTTWSPFPKARD